MADATARAGSTHKKTRLYLDGEAAELKRREDLGHDLDALCIRNHGLVLAGYVDVALVELSVAATGQHRLIAAVHPGNVVSLLDRNGKPNEDVRPR